MPSPIKEEHSEHSEIPTFPAQDSESKSKNNKSKKEAAGCHLLLHHDDTYYSILGLSTRGRCKCGKSKCTKCENIYCQYSDTGGKVESVWKKNIRESADEVLGKYSIVDGSVNSIISNGTPDYDGFYEGDLDKKYTALREVMEETFSPTANEPSVKHLIDIEVIVRKLYIDNEYHLILNDDGYHTYVIVLTIDDFQDTIQEKILDHIQMIEDGSHYKLLCERSVKPNKNYERPRWNSYSESVESVESVESEESDSYETDRTNQRRDERSNRTWSKSEQFRQSGQYNKYNRKAGSRNWRSRDTRTRNFRDTRNRNFRDTRDFRDTRNSKTYRNYGRDSSYIKTNKSRSYNDIKAKTSLMDCYGNSEIKFLGLFKLEDLFEASYDGNDILHGCLNPTFMESLQKNIHEYHDIIN